MIQNLNKLKEIDFQSQRVSLITHSNPDGDAIGSSIGLGVFIENCGGTATIITPNEMPSNLKQLEGAECILDFKRDAHIAAKAIAESDIIICIDFNEIHTRIGNLEAPISANKKALRILIDHHIIEQQTNFDIIISDTSASSTAFLIFKVITHLEGVEAITKQIATAIYTGMITDTGNFSYSNLSSELFQAVSVIIERGAEPVKINSMIFNTKSEAQLRLNGFALEKKMVIMPQYNCGYISLTKEELDSFGYKPGYTEGLVNMPLSIEGITLSALFMENPECIKISLRSRGEQSVDVNSLARNHFSGGGHRNAAGAKSFVSMEQTITDFINLLK